MARELPDKYKACDWVWNYGSIGLTKEHIKRLNNAINILESLNEHTDAKYLKEIKDKLIKNKLLEDTPNIEKTNTDAFIEKATKWIGDNLCRYDCESMFEKESLLPAFPFQTCFRNHIYKDYHLSI